MEITPSQKQQQQLTLTPSLRLALKVLHMPLIELQAYLYQQLEENPLLEKVEESHESSDTPAETKQTEDESPDLDSVFSDLWRETDTYRTPHQDEEEFQPDVAARSNSLHEHLIHQLYSLQDTEPLRKTAEILLGWLDPDGYLRSPLEEISEAEGLPVPELEQGLTLIQRFDPPGVGARNLQECLLIQLSLRNESDSLAAEIVRSHFDLFVKRKLSQLALKLKTGPEQVQEAALLIGQLDPKPARNFSPDLSLAITPDLTVRQLKNNGYDVELNDEDLPALSLNTSYRGLLRTKTVDSEAKNFIREKMQQGTWLLKAIRQRKTTLLSIAKCLVELEKDYFTHGIQHLRSVTQEEVAHMIGCHPSTVSRAIAGKTIQTPYGILSLETFFGGGIEDPSNSGKHLSAQTIQAEIENLISQEKPSKPLSDQEIAKALIERGYPVARRTVAKYRSQLNILPAHYRQKTG